MFTNQIPDQPDFARSGVPPANPFLANASEEMYPQSGRPPQGWGLSWFLTLKEGDTGRVSLIRLFSIPFFSVSRALWGELLLTLGCIGCEYGVVGWYCELLLLGR